MGQGGYDLHGGISPAGPYPAWKARSSNREEGLFQAATWKGTDEAGIRLRNAWAQPGAPCTAYLKARNDKAPVRGLNAAQADLSSSVPELAALGGPLCSLECPMPTAERERTQYGASSATSQGENGQQGHLHINRAKTGAVRQTAPRSSLMALHCIDGVRS